MTSSESWWVKSQSIELESAKNLLLVANSKLAALVNKLKATSGARVFKRGYERAVELLNKGESIFAWAPSFRGWLKDPDYVFWLGAGGLSFKN